MKFRNRRNRNYDWAQQEEIQRQIQQQQIFQQMNNFGMF